VLPLVEQHLAEVDLTGALSAAEAVPATR
jgi:hypothetical protein